MQKKLIVCFCFVLIGPVLSWAGDAAKDQKELQGTWKPLSLIANGKESPVRDEILLIFKGNQFMVKKGANIINQGTFTLKSSAKPAQIDMKVEKGLGGVEGRIILGIYAFDGKNLKVCLSDHQATARPTEFTAVEGSGRSLGTFALEKK